MKTYLRILQYARPFASFLPQYLACTLLAIFFGLANFTLIIPLLKVLFDKTDKVPLQAPDQLPAFQLSLDWIKDTFNFYFADVLAAQGKMGALAFVCVIVVVSVLLSNVFRYLSLRLLAQVRARVIRNLRRALYYRIVELQLQYFAGERKGDLMSRFTSDVQEVDVDKLKEMVHVKDEDIEALGKYAPPQGATR